MPPIPPDQRSPHGDSDSALQPIPKPADSSVYEARGPPNQRSSLQTEPGASTIGEFCKRQRISKPLYYKIRGLGLGPKEMRFAGVVRISHAAESDWQKARENPTEAEAEAVARTASARRTRAVKAAAKAIASPAHISKNRRSQVA